MHAYPMTDREVFLKMLGVVSRKAAKREAAIMANLRTVNALTAQVDYQSRNDNNSDVEGLVKLDPVCFT